MRKEEEEEEGGGGGGGSGGERSELRSRKRCRGCCLKPRGGVLQPLAQGHDGCLCDRLHFTAKAAALAFGCRGMHTQLTPRAPGLVARNAVVVVDGREQRLLLILDVSIVVRCIPQASHGVQRALFPRRSGNL